MAKQKIREFIVILLIIAGFVGVLYLIFRTRGFLTLDPDSLSDEEIALIKAAIRNHVLWAGLLIGGVMGAIVQRSKFCIAAACHSVVTIKDLSQTRAYATALIVAILGTQILYRTGEVDITRCIYIASPVTWLSFMVGGFVFGVGIVYAGGCASRILVRASEGNLGGLVSVMAFIFSSGATLWGILALVRVDYFNQLTLNLKTQYIPHLLQQFPFWVVILIVEVLLFVFVLSAPRDSEWWGMRWPVAGVAIGLTVILAWWINGAAYRAIPFIDSFSFTGPDDPTLLQTWRPKSLTFALADAQTFRYIIMWTGEKMNFGIATVFGVIGGALSAAMVTGTFHWVAPPLQQFKYNLVGGLLMGFGAVLALGCNIGQGLSGFSTLSFGSILTMTFILIGAISGARFMNWQLMREV
ncbi:MAG: YeeE/YedE family protein [Deltaproteobacteria bacterium]|nr:YeeE/YedE family protein [Deltaproteobacteria bacterium]